MYCKAVLTSVRKDMNLLKEVILDQRSCSETISLSKEVNCMVETSPSSWITKHKGVFENLLFQLSHDLIV